MILPGIVAMVEHARDRHVYIDTPAGQSIWTCGRLRAPNIKTAPRFEAWIWIREVAA
jgi:hypothetical protein